MEIRTKTPQGEEIIISEEPGGVYGGRLRFEIRSIHKEFCATFEIYLKDFEKVARCFLGKIKKQGKGEG